MTFDKNNLGVHSFEQFTSHLTQFTIKIIPDMTFLI
jgi:hypothetical protein